MKTVDVILEDRTFGFPIPVLKHLDDFEEVVAHNTSSWSWEYDADAFYAIVVYAHGNRLIGYIVRSKLLNMHTKSGLGKGVTTALKGKVEMGTLQKPKLGAIRELMKQFQHDRSSAGGGWSRFWYDSNGKRTKLLDAIKEFQGRPMPNPDYKPGIDVSVGSGKVRINPQTGDLLP